MKKQMKRTVYEAPVTERFSVELEGGFMSASIMETEGTVGDVTSGSQGYVDYSGNDGFEIVKDAEGNNTNTIWY